jgi:RNA polymerase sigma factor (sigma-70 family)
MCRFYDCDNAAFDALALRWRPRLARFFRRWGFRQEVVDDLTQDLLINLYLTKERMSFDLDQPLEPFVYAAARNRAIKQFREGQQDVTLGPWMDDLDLAEKPPGLHTEARDDLFMCIESLPETERRYLCLCEKHGLGELSHNEIADALGKWPAQITRISRRALSHLRECMEAKGYR